MLKKTINCPSCEVKCDVIIRQSNYENEEVEIEYCPICSASITDSILLDVEDDDEWPVSGI